MENITSIAELKNAIELSEIELTLKGKVLKEQFSLAYESFKPANLLSNTLSDIAKSPYLIDNILGTVIGLATGYLSKKIFIGASGSKIKKLIGTVLQFGITNVVAQNSDSIKSFGRFLFQHFSRKKEINTEKPWKMKS
jgi:hypothetical protein